VRRSSLVLVATSLAAFTATLDNTIVAVALRAMQSDLGASVPGLQGVVTAYTVTLGSLLLLGGALVDVLGAKWVLLTGLALFAAASAGCALAGSAEVLIGMRAVQGVGAAVLLPAALALLTLAHDDTDRRRRALGVWAAAGGLALVAGPVLGGVLVQAYGWQSVFWINVPLCLAVGAVIATTRPTPAAGGRVEIVSNLLTTGGMAALTYAVVLYGRGGHDGRAALALGASVVCFLVAARAPSESVREEVWRDRRFVGAWVGATGASLAVFVLMVFLALFLELVQEVGARPAGLVLLPLPVALVITAPIAGRMRSTAVPVAAGLVVAGAGLVALGLVLREHTSHLTIELLLALVGAGVGLTTAPVVSAAVDVAGPALAGRASAAMSMARELGGIIAVAGLGALAVNRLTARLSDRLAEAGVADKQQPHLLDLLLRADTDGVRRALLHDIGVEKTLRLGSGLTDTATASFVSSTRLVLVVAGALLVATAALCGRLLRK
jgi:DHA2 family methylenomycin A resistance protein-like MFS transporter